MDGQRHTLTCLQRYRRGVIDIYKLRGRIIEKYRTIYAFAKAMGVTSAYVSYMINGKVKWSDKWKTRAMWLLDIPEADEAVFFPEEVNDEKMDDNQGSIGIVAEV